MRLENKPIVSLGAADKREIAHCNRVIIRTFVELKAKGKINPTYAEELGRIEIFLRYAKVCAIGMNAIDRVIDPDNVQRFQEFKNDISQYGITAENFMNVHTSLLLYNFLQFYSQAENIMIALLKGATYGKNNNQTVTGKEELGRLINDVIGSVYKNNGLSEFVDTKFRNALAHGWCFVNDDRLHYYTDGTLKNLQSLSIYELLLKFRKMNLFTLALMQTVTHTSWV
ncbi:hypothetical protein NTE_02105 [Candidatus Nitrososphaera evergladensis SR1]|uniref:Uncharacterized protein n=1 Tax=Candidatus Nitrososphaera evergladensis SR1 TaxID=1459636 RepID=A0A075MSP3_9ARCH|nr:hypothetical protein [Candidatus Nitrososphaera evergladensis]AIF84160.1 hypothetical protein NTE_02105 [Candidatus Nitrososphaera evergladensis SR1]